MTKDPIISDDTENTAENSSENTSASPEILNWRQYVSPRDLALAEDYYAVGNIFCDYHPDSDQGIRVPINITGEIYSPGARQYKSVSCSIQNLPRNTDFSITMAYLTCDLKTHRYLPGGTPSKFVICSHIAALLLTYEKEHGPIMLPKGPLGDRKQILEDMVKSITENNLEFLNIGFDRIVAAYELDCFRNLDTTGMSYYNIPGYLRSNFTTAFIAHSVAEILKQEQPAIEPRKSSVEYVKTKSGTVLRAKLAFVFSASGYFWKNLTVIISEKTITWENVPDILNFLPKRCYKSSFLNETQIIALLWIWKYLNEHPVFIDETDDKALTFIRNMHRNFIDYESRFLETEPSESPIPRSTVTFFPYIMFRWDGEVWLSLKISISGNPKKYMVRDISTLIRALYEKKTYKLGSKNSIDFGRDVLSPESRKLTGVMQSWFLTSYDPQVHNRLKYFSDNVNYLPLGGAYLDRFWTDMENCTVFSDEDLENPLAIGHVPITIPVNISEKMINNRVSSIIVSGNTPNIIRGAEHLYCRISDCLSRLDPEERKQLDLFSAVMDKDGNFRFSVGIRGLNDFWHRVLPVLQESPCIQITDNTEKVTEVLLPKPEFTFYLDIEEKRKYDNLVLYADVAYGEQVFHLGGPKKKDHAKNSSVIDISDLNPADTAQRDIVYENSIIAILDSVFSERRETEVKRPGDPVRYFWFQQMDDENLFQFLRQRIGELEYYGTVKGSAGFNRIRITRINDVRVGISVSGGLLGFDVTSRNLSGEELADIMTSYSLKKRWHRLKSGAFVDLTTSQEIREIAEMLEKLNVLPADVILKKNKIPLFRALYLDKLMAEHESLSVNRDQTFRQLVRNFSSIRDSDYDPPEALREIMREYQVFGFKWLSTIKNSGFGGILADDMGLGKTLQMISLLLADKLERNKNPANVVIDTVSETVAITEPDTAVIPADGAAASWQESGNNVSPDTAAIPDSGSVPLRRGHTLVVAPASLVYNWTEEIKRFAPELSAVPLTATAAKRKAALLESEKTDIFVISYDLLSRDLPLVREIAFEYLIIDEAQYIKNPRSGYARSVKSITAKTRFALTGTPIENRLSELWSIFDFIMPGFLYSYTEFQGKFEDLITRDQDPEATEKLRAMTSPFILRRKKSDVLKNLPGKMEEVFYTKISGEQQKLYDAQVLKMKQTISICSGSTRGEDKIKIIAELMRIRQLCCDPSLVYSNYTGGSSKKDACLELIESAIDGGHRILLFSQFTSMLDILKKELNARNISFYEITGATSKEKRIELVRNFNAGTTPLFLISRKAGGTGLNLTGADTVIHYDPWWNLAAMNQATDRAHRIGQTKVVTEYKLIMKDTIEEKILQLQETKKDLADSILEGTATSLMSLSPDELMDLLS